MIVLAEKLPRQLAFSGLLVVTTLVLFGCAEKQPVAAALDQYQEAMQAAREWQGPIHPVAKQLYDQGMERYRAGDWSQAAGLLGRAAEVGVKNFPYRAEALIYQSQALRKMNQYLECAQVARAAIKDFPERWEPRLILAEYHIWRENYESAQQELAAAAQIAPDRPEIQRTFAKVLMARGLTLPAMEAARQAYVTNPKDADSQSLLGRIYLAQARQWEREGDLDNAMTTLFAAMDLQPDNPTPVVLMGRLLLRADLPDAARRYTHDGRQRFGDPAKIPRDCVALEPLETDEEAYAYLRMAEFYLSREQPEAAAQQLEQALSADYRMVEAWQKLGLVRAKYLQDQPGARECLHAMWLLAPDDPKTKDLETTLALKSEAKAAESPGFVLRAQVGAGYNAARRTVTNEGASFPVGTRLYFVLVVGNAVGRHAVRLQVQDQTDREWLSQTWPVEFFGRDFALVSAGSWTAAGTYRIVWSVDGVTRAQKGFELK